MNRAVEDALKVTEAMVEAAAMVVANFGCESESPTPWEESSEEVREGLHEICRTQLTAALAHPDFRKQVAELMRSMVPDEKRIPMYADRDALRAVGANRFRTETLARIAEWENANDQ